MRKVSKMGIENVLLNLRYAKEDLKKVRDWERENVALSEVCVAARSRIEKVSNMLTEFLEKEG